MFSTKLCRVVPIVCVAISGLLGCEPFVGDNLPVSSTMNLEMYSAVAFNSLNNEFMVLWWDKLRGADSYSVRCRRIHGCTGEVVGESILVGESNFDSGIPHIVYNPDRNEYLAAWYAYQGQILSSQEILVRVLDGDTGEPIGEPVVLTEDINEDMCPRVAYNPVDQEYMVSYWTWEKDYPSLHRIYGRRLDAATIEPLGDPIIIAYEPTTFYFMNSITYNPIQHEYLVAFAVFYDLGIGGHGFCARRLDAATGSPIGPIIPVHESPYRIDWPYVAVNERDNEYMFSWINYINHDDRRYDVLVTRMDGADGEMLGDAVLVSHDLFCEQDTTIAYNPKAGVYLVAWSDDDLSFLTGTDILGQLLTARGEFIGRTITLCNARHNQYWPQAAYNPTNDRFLVSWHDGRNEDLEWDIYAQQLNGFFVY